MSRALLLSAILAICLAAAPAVAAPTLIAEFLQEAIWFTPGNQLPTEVGFSFGVHNQPTNATAHWSQVLTTAEIGQTFIAPMDVVADFAAIPISPQTYLVMNIGPQPGGEVQLMDLQPLPPMNSIPVGTLHVPDVADYVISGIDRTIDDVVIEWVPTGEGQYYYIGGAQTVRLYGTLVPEPSTVALGLLALAIKTFVR